MRDPSAARTFNSGGCSVVRVFWMCDLHTTTVPPPSCICKPPAREDCMERRTPGDPPSPQDTFVSHSNLHGHSFPHPLEVTSLCVVAVGFHRGERELTQGSLRDI